MATTLAANGTTSATFSMGAFDSFYVNSSNGAAGTMVFTSLAQPLNSNFTAKVASGNYGPYGVPVSVTITVSGGSMTYQLAGNVGSYAYNTSNAASGYTGTSGEIWSLTEVTDYVNLTATGTAFSGACEFAGYICTVAAGNITVYDNTSAAGTVIVPTTALVVGAFPIFGAGTNGKMALATGCHVVLSGAGTVNVLVG